MRWDAVLGPAAAARVGARLDEAGLRKRLATARLVQSIGKAAATSRLEVQWEKARAAGRDTVALLDVLDSVVRPADGGSVVTDSASYTADELLVDPRRDVVVKWIRRKRHVHIANVAEERAAYRDECIDASDARDLIQAGYYAQVSIERKQLGLRDRPPTRPFLCATGAHGPPWEAIVAAYIRPHIISMRREARRYNREVKARLVLEDHLAPRMGPVAAAKLIRAAGESRLSPRRR